MIRLPGALGGRKEGVFQGGCLMIWRACGEVDARKIKDSKASPSLLQPGMDIRSSVINSTHTGMSRTFS